MDYLLTEREEQLLGWVGELADRFAERAGQHDRENTFPHENFRDMREAGFMRLTVPEELGGGGASLRELMLAQERLAMGCPSTSLAVVMHTGPIAGMADLWRNDPQPAVEAILRRVAEDEVIWAALTAERGGGSNLITDSGVEARRVDGGFRVNGGKIFCTNTEACTHFSFTARYEDPERGPLVIQCQTAKDADGIEFVQTWDTLGMRGTQSNDLEIRDLFVADENVIHSFPAGHLDPIVVRTGLAFAMALFGIIYLGVAGGAMDWARDYTIERGMDADPETVHLFAEMEVLRETGRAMVWQLASEIEAGGLWRRGVQEALASGVVAKYVAANNAVAILDRVMDTVGGVGFHRRFPIERIYRDVRAATIMPVNNRDAHSLLGKTALGGQFMPIGPERGAEAPRPPKRPDPRAQNAY
ncbi:MAG: acyl-CoA/acyl-ACP dehydrogenase [Actinobacteria bacterium]|nr:acyl-CoA/acyl-ACP dehydrogenase [Actinomycetota bacterium]